MRLGYGNKAISVTAALVRLEPHDAGLVSNHALALLIGGTLSEVQRAMQLDPHDPITQNLFAFIDDVRAGRTARPSRLT